MKDKTIKRKILKDRKLPDSGQINKHQDFSRLHQDYGIIKKLLLKKTMTWLSVVLGTVGIAGVILLNQPAATRPEAKPEVSQELQAVPCIQPPIPGQETQYATYRISSKNGGVIHHSTGSTVFIPPAAFLNENGQPVGDSINIRYREFHDPLAIFLSGIPMEYDSAGLSRTFESAGMIEIQAFDGKMPLRVAEQKPIHIQMVSSTEEARFNLYELDTIHKNWVYIGKDHIEKISKPRPAQPRKEGNTTRRMTGNSIRPELSDPQHYLFRINYDKNDFPELAAYDNVLFEVTDHSFKPAYYKVNWSKILLYTGDEPGHYIVKLKKADTTISVTAKPVFDKASYADARATFEEQHKAASVQRDQRAFEQQEAVTAVNKGLTGYSATSMLAAAYNMAQGTARRSFAIRSTGVYNIDYPLPPIVQFALSIKSAADTKRRSGAAREVMYSTIFLVEKGKNAVFRFSKGEPVKCNPAAKNLMWTVTDKNEIAFFRIADYSKLANGSENKISPVVAGSQQLAFEEIKKFSTGL